MNKSKSIDLHNCTVDEALRRFAVFYNECVRDGHRGRIEVIHGYGSNGTGGVIREQLRAYLKVHEEVFGEFLAGESLRNPGVTVVYAKESLAPIPGRFNSLPSPGGRGGSRRKGLGGRANR